MKYVCVEHKSKSIGAVVELLSLMGRPTAPLPESVKIRDAILVLSSKKNAYYVTSAEACSCPAYAFHSRPCKHQRKYFGEACAIKEAANTEAVLDSIKPIMKWPRGHSGF